MRWLIAAIALVPFFHGMAQESVWNYDDYNKITHETFRDKKIFHQPIDVNNVDYPLLHAAVFYVTNEVRVKKRLEPFTFNLNLEISAWNHSKEMAEKGFFSHNNHKDKDRHTPNDRAKFAGISNPFLAENIAEVPALQYKAGSPVYILDKENGTFSYQDGGEPIAPETYLGVAEIVIDQWMDSKPHRKNILSKDGLQLGCGAYLYKDKRFYNMPTFKMTQNFQWYEPIEAMKPMDRMPD